MYEIRRHSFFGVVGRDRFYLLGKNQPAGFKKKNPKSMRNLESLYHRMERGHLLQF